MARVDKAANCIYIMCKACYVLLATEEMEGPEYSRVEGVDLASIKSTIVKRQRDFLGHEFLPILHVRKQSEEDPLATILVPTAKLPVRYIQRNCTRSRLQPGVLQPVVGPLWMELPGLLTSVSRHLDLFFLPCGGINVYR